MSPAVCGPVPQVEKAVMLSDRALRRVVWSTRGSATVPPDGGDSYDDLRPLSKRSRQALSLSPPRGEAWVDVRDFWDSGSSYSLDDDVGDDVRVPVAPVGRVAAVIGHVVGLSPGPVSSPAASASPVAGSPRWEVVAPAEVAGEGGDLVLVLKKDSVPAAPVPLASMSVPSAPLPSVLLTVARLPSAQPSFVAPPPMVSAPAPSPSVIVSPATLPAVLPPCIRPAPAL
nr:translation initiation factor IF-2-like [Procambarus clarkii]